MRTTETSRRGALVVAALLTAALASCSGSAEDTSDSGQDGAAVEESPATSTTARSLGAGQRAHPVGVSFQAGHFVVTVGEVVHDEDAGQLFLGMRMENLADVWTSAEAHGRLMIDGQELFVNIPAPPRVPPGMATDVTAVVHTGDLDPIGDGVLHWGHPEEPGTTVRLADGTAEGFGLPLELPVDAWGQIGRHALHLSSGRLFADAVRGPRTDAGQRVLRVVFDEYTSQASPVNGFVPVDHLLLEWPDGTIVDPIGGSDARFPMSWTGSTNGSVDFPVPADPGGAYRVLLASVGRHSLSLLHPDLVERVAMPVTIPSVADHGPVPVADADLPRPQLPAEEAAPTAEPVDVALDVHEVNVPGFGVRATRVEWSPKEERARVTAQVRLLPSAMTGQADPRGAETDDPTPARVDLDELLDFDPDADGDHPFGDLDADGLVSADDVGSLLDVAPSFDVSASLSTSGVFVNGMIAELPTGLTVDRPVEVTWEFPFVTSLDLATATLVIGPDRVEPATVPLGPGSPYSLQPPVPEEHPITAPAVTGGNYTVELVSYRFGVPRPTDRPPAGLRALEVIFDVTAREIEPPGAFGLQFRARSQLFLASSDGYLQQSDNHDFAELIDGQTVRMGASFYVPSRWQPGPLGFVVRSRDELTTIEDAWVEVTFAAVLHGPDATTATPADAGEPADGETGASDDGD